MSRNIFLADAQADGIKAKLNDGVLTITVPKKVTQVSAKLIDIE